MSQNSLDYPLDRYRSLIDKTADLIIQKFETMDDQKAYAGLSPTEVRGWFDESVPEAGMEPELLLDIVKEKVLDTATLNMAPKMFAYVMSGGNHISTLAEMIATTINQNVGKWHLAPIMSELERRVVQWGSDFVGFGDDVGGVLVSGGSGANLTCLTVARNVFFEEYGIRKKGLFGMKPFTVYGSSETHGCVDKSMELLGIGTDNYRKIAINRDWTIDLIALKAQIEQDIEDGYRPFCLIGNAGTVNTGAIDPLEKLSSIAKKYDMWYHIDGAYGGLAAAIPEVKELYKGMDLADSLAIDYHKWLYQPFEVGCAIVKNWNNLNRSYHKSASYLSSDASNDGRFDFNSHHFQLSRNAKALKVWMSFKAYGGDKIRSMISKDITLTQYLADLVAADAQFELCHDPVTGIVCFRYLGLGDLSDDKIDQLNKRIIPALESDGRIFITGTILYNRPVIRACLINHRMQEKDLDYLVAVLKDVGAKV